MQAELLEPHRRHLFGLCYRLTGSAADAEDLVQDTFARALERPPADEARSLKPWLTKVALNLGRDALRRRQAKSYVGPWLPAPILTGEEPLSVEAHLDDGGSTAGRYEMMESVSFAFLVALEALSPKQRAVLLLRDVFDYSGSEAAEALDLSFSDVKVSLHRARAKMTAYDATRARPSPELEARTRDVLGQLVAALGQQDHVAVNALVADEARAFNDGAGEFFSALRPIEGRQNVVRFLLGLAQKRPVKSLEVRQLNGAPGLLMTFEPLRPKDAPRAVFSVDLDADGKVGRLYTILATEKLSATP